jgi:hypothetical protein
MTQLFHWILGSAMFAVMVTAAGLAGADDTPATTQAAPAAQPATTAPAPAEASKAVPVAPSPAATPAAAVGGDSPLYVVKDGNHVDKKTMQGWRTWRAMACERCHGANQEGLVGPSLNDGLKTMSRDDFNKCVLDGRVDKGMPNFGGVQSVVDNLDNLYAFLKGRSDGAIPTGHLKDIE